MTIYFGTAFDDSNLPLILQESFGVDYYGPKKLINYLSMLMGLPKAPSGSDYLRLEQYRQAIVQTIEQAATKPFYISSFQADQFAVTTDLLSRRDELLLSGWDFNVGTNIPQRIQALQAIEQHFKTVKKFWCYEDRLHFLLNHLEEAPLHIEEVLLIDPLELLNPALKQLFQILKHKGTNIIPAFQSPIPSKQTDLGHFKNVLLGHTEQKAFSGDGSLIILEGNDEVFLANYITKSLTATPSFKPLFLMGSTCNTLDYAFLQEGIPAFGTATMTYAKPSLQILKLATNFLWQPMDPYRLLEFVSLQIKPLNSELAWRIGKSIAQFPGIKGPRWTAMINQFFRELEIEDPSQFNEVRSQYEFWFERPTFTHQSGAPIETVLEIFAFLEKWAFDLFKTEGEKDENLLNLSVQAKNIKDLLGIYPKMNLSPLEIERVVRTIHEPGTEKLLPTQTGFYHYFNQAGAIIQPVSQLIWWNFLNQDPTYFFSRWYEEERNYLNNLGLELDSPKRENQYLNWTRKRPFLMAENQIIACIPKKHNGQAVEPNPYIGNIHAAFSNFKSYDPGKPEDRIHLDRFFSAPAFQTITPRSIEEIPAFIQLPKPIHIEKLDRTESPTSLEDFLYFPYKWFFKYYCKIRPSGLLSIIDHSALLGKLAHRLLEELLIQEHQSWSKQAVEEWIEQRSKKLFLQEGSVLLLYGQEAERVNLVNRVKFSAWTLISALRNNEWQVKQTEIEMNGTFVDLAIKGRSDLVLERQNEQLVVDLKWKGITFRKQLLKNEEDLQLILYAYLLKNVNQPWPSTAYYILERAQLLSRNPNVLKEAIVISSGEEENLIQERIYTKMKNTYQWRQLQLKAAEIEVRTDTTAHELEEVYADRAIDFMEMLEMKNTSAPFDDYRTLVQPFQ